MITAVELGENLAEYSRQKFLGNPNIKIVNSSFENYEDGQRYDLIYSATAFHWIDPEIGYPKALSMLKEGGSLALFWNRPFAAMEDNPMHVEIQNVYSKYRPGSAKPKRHGEKDRLKILNAIKSFGFKDTETRLYCGQRNFSADEYIGLLSTYSDHIAMQEDVKRLFEKEIAEIINKLGGTMTIFDTMDLYLAKRP